MRIRRGVGRRAIFLKGFKGVGRVDGRGLGCWGKNEDEGGQGVKGAQPRFSRSVLRDILVYNTCIHAPASMPVSFPSPTSCLHRN